MQYLFLLNKKDKFIHRYQGVQTCIQKYVNIDQNVNGVPKILKRVKRMTLNKKT